MSILSEVLESGNAAVENLNKIEQRLFEVQDIEMQAPHEGWENPKGKMIYTSEGIHLGNTGEIYQSLQPKDFFDAVVDNVRNTGMDLDLSKLEYNVIQGGKIVEFRLPTNIISFKNNVGKTDETKLFLNFWTGYGGSARTEIGLYSHRFICSNGMRIVNAEVDLKVKHTPNMNTKALKFAQEIIKVASKVQSTSQMWKEMNSVEVNDSTTEKFIREITKVKKEETYADLSTRKKNIYDTVQDAVQEEFNRTGTTVYGLLSGITNYTNHKAGGSKNSDYILTATGAKTNTLAQKLALELV